MARTKVVAVYQPNDGETFQVVVEIGSGYPDAVAEARAQAVRGVHELIADARAQYGEVTESRDVGGTA